MEADAPRQHAFAAVTAHITAVTQADLPAPGCETVTLAAFPQRSSESALLVRKAAVLTAFLSLGVGLYLFAGRSTQRSQR